jgi:hypothetical protein
MLSRYEINFQNRSYNYVSFLLYEIWVRLIVREMLMTIENDRYIDTENREEHKICLSLRFTFSCYEELLNSV